MVPVFYVFLRIGRQIAMIRRCLNQFATTRSLTCYKIEHLSNHILMKINCLTIHWQFLWTSSNIGSVASNVFCEMIIESCTTWRHSQLLYNELLPTEVAIFYHIILLIPHPFVIQYITCITMNNNERFIFKSHGSGVLCVSTDRPSNCNDPTLPEPICNDPVFNMLYTRRCHVQYQNTENSKCITPYLW